MSVKSTVLELPPEAVGLDEDSYVEAGSVDEVAQRAHISDTDVLARILLPGAMIGPYRVLGFVAAGGMGEIYAAERLMEDGRRLGPVALKLITATQSDDWMLSERFKREGEISKAIRSPYVIRVYEFGESADGRSFMSMEFLRGEELFDRLGRLGRLEPRDAGELFVDILRGLEAIHDAGVIHRDLKPENIYFATDKEGVEHVKILDFGIAKRANAPSDPYLSVVGKIYGTPEYIAPEQGLSPDVDPRADLYAVGVMLFECLTGVLPFEGDSAYQTILKHQTEPIPEVGGYADDSLASIVNRAMQKKPRDRFQNATEFREALEAWLRGEELDISATSGELTVKRRHETPARSNQTPASGTPAPRRRVEQLTAPPIEIQGGRRPSPAPVEASAQELELVDEEDEEPTQPSVLPGIITFVAVLLIVIALVLVFTL